MSRLLVDTNVLLRSFEADHPLAIPAAVALAELGLERELVYGNQTAAEFLSVATRRRNGLGLTPKHAFEAFEEMTSSMVWLPEPEDVLQRLRSLYDEQRVRPGANLYDAKLAAFGLVHNLDGILTFNGRDFARTGLPVVDPRDIEEA